MADYIVERIVDHRPKSAKHVSDVKKFHVKWEGYGDNEKTWEPKTNLNEPTINEYWRSLNKTDDNTVAADVADDIAIGSVIQKPKSEENVEEYVVEAIAGVLPKTATCDKDAKKYIIKWEGFGDDEKTTEPASDIRKSAPVSVSDFWKAQKNSNDQGDNEMVAEVMVTKRGRTIRQVLPAVTELKEPSKKKMKIVSSKSKKAPSPSNKQKPTASKLEEKNDQQLLEIVNKLNDRLEVLEARSNYKEDRELLITLSKRDDLPRSVASKIRQHLKK